MRNFVCDSPTFLAQFLMMGAKMTTTGVLLRKADNAAMVGKSFAFALVTVVCLLGKRFRMILSKIPLRRTPSLTRKSRATVIMPLLEKPSKHSLGCRMPAHSIITTHVKRMSPGFNLSAISAHIMNTRQKATNITLKAILSK